MELACPCHILGVRTVAFEAWDLQHNREGLQRRVSEDAAKAIRADLSVTQVLMSIAV